MGDLVILKLHSSPGSLSHFELVDSLGLNKKSQDTLKPVGNHGRNWLNTGIEVDFTHTSTVGKRTLPTPRLKFNAVKLGVLEKRRIFMYLHPMNSCFVHSIYLCERYYCNIQTFWCFKVKIWKFLIENLAWNIKWHLSGQHQEMCLQCCVDQKRRLLGKGTHKILRGIRSLHWKCSNLRHCRVFNGFYREWIIWIETLESIHWWQGDLLTEKTGRSRSGLGFMISRPWKKKARLISRSFVRKLQRTKKNTELNSCGKKGTENLKFYLDMFSSKLHRVPWVRKFWHLTVDGWSFPGTRSQREDNVGGVISRQVVASYAESWVREMPGLGSAKGCEEETHARRGHIKYIRSKWMETKFVKIWCKSLHMIALFFLKLLLQRLSLCS